MAITTGGPSRLIALRRAAVLVPLGLLSAAWTLGLAAGSSLDGTAGRPLPDGTRVPSQAIQQPASVTSGDSLGLGIGTADTEQIVSTSTTSGIPSAALAAYQRAETAIDAADPSCHLPWQLVAAIGRVESNHGRANGNVLNDAGIDEPGIYGVQLDGSGGTVAIADSDAGQYDDDLTYDRAVGPMQFIPSTWSVVGVDADGDGIRDPQDINDAALGAAVFLCSGGDDLATAEGQRAAVYRYNHSQDYVDLVLAVMRAYLNGDFTTIPNGTLMAGEITRYDAPVITSPGPGTGTQLLHQGPHQVTTATPSARPTGRPTSAPTTTVLPSITGAPTAGPSYRPTDGPTDESSDQPSERPSDTPTDSPTDEPSPSITPIGQALNEDDAIARCVLDGFDQVFQATEFQQCVDYYMDPTTDPPSDDPGGSDGSGASDG